MAKDKEKVRLTTPVFVASYPNLFKAKPGGENGDGKLKYGVTAIFNPATFTPADKARWDKLLAALDAESKKTHGKPWAKLNPLVYKKGLRRNGDRENPFENFPEDAMFCNITSDFKPGVVDINKDTISQEEGNDDLVYPGCLCRATVNVYSFTKKGKGVALGLNNVQVISSDESKWPRLDNRANAAEDFDDDIDAAWLDEAGDSVEDEDDNDY